ncbi:2-oxoglutarate (2OG) and Fe(II)-dependent oxygenase superfamily protein [Striga asiatica]|uniref:2-oxoglutarate (2OG) and Fe(II)-dependent oxygenase superfamily protein n=1 Tax=Striga asiatica TaxID=4170 RepID=A0A5A7Q924_STRAF|nr:2-oxoglutarate (2OG) and Fe(II)-dependent oxygenase superfamily protein [Striga asiatica]
MLTVILNGAECRMARILDSFEYSAISCRAHITLYVYGIMVMIQDSILKVPSSPYRRTYVDGMQLAGGITFEPPKYRYVIYGDYVSSWYTKGPERIRNMDGLL